MTQKPVKPSTTYRTVVRLYTQADIVEALGIKIKPDDLVRVECDGSNKVIVTVYK